MEENKITTSTIWMAFIMFILGTGFGCFIMYTTHKDIYHHYNVCQEQELIESISEMEYKIVIDSLTGKISIK